MWDGKAPDATSDSELARQQDVAARMFVDVARDATGHEFTFAESDLPALESFVDRLWDPTVRPSEDELDSLTKLIGAYFGETIIRTIGGQWRWHRERQIPVLVVNGVEAFVLDAAYKRQVNRTPGSLTSFYQQYRAMATSDRT